MEAQKLTVRKAVLRILGVRGLMMYIPVFVCLFVVSRRLKTVASYVQGDVKKS